MNQLAQTNNIVTIENLNPVELYTGGGLDKVIASIEEEVRAFVPDMTTDTGRKAIASIAYKVAKSKTALDDAGKKLTADWKARSKLVDGSRKAMRERLGSLKEEVRKPLTEWEEAEKLRIKHHEENLDRILTVGVESAEFWSERTVEEMEESLVWLKDMLAEDWDEFAAKAVEVCKQAEINIKHGIAQHKAYDKAEADRAEAEKKAQAEREKQIAKEAAEHAKREAEEKADRERIAAEQAEKERIEKIEADKQAALDRAEKEKQDAVQAQNDARAKIERERKEAAEAMKMAQEKAEREKEAAIQAERDRQAAEDRAFKEKEVELAEQARRKAANKAHQKRINNEALDSLTTQFGMDEAVAKQLITAIALGEIKHVVIGY